MVGIAHPTRLVRMAEPVGTSNSPDKDIEKAVSDYVSRLSEEHKMLVALKAQLYGGSWEPMLGDLRNRLSGKPYIFKLVHRIQDDIERIEEMRQFETRHKVDLAEYVDLS
ncbi:MAG: hypothetical protein A2Y77_17865 [Planctomycetes bacterium RBG_13_62_9]|nr:MAG: hypothetical protein A2Y77_17865 [Planctomycetes bacterium RBG_13_62_9]